MDVENVSFAYGAFQAVKQVSLRLMKNTVHSVIGPNGAGKTTFFNVLTGRLIAHEGRILLDGKDITNLPERRRVALGLGRSFQITSLFPEFSVFENLRIAAQGPHAAQTLALWRTARSLPQSIERAEAVMERLGLTAKRADKVSDLSHGEQRVLEIGMSLAVSPQVLLLDEPTSGMGVDGVRQMAELIQNLKQDNAILVIEHNMDIVMGISDRITVMAGGSVIVEGTSEEVRNNAMVRSVYLGGA